jgi:hypothetical protein
MLAPRYEPRRQKETVLYDLVREHLGAFLDHAREAYDKPLPRYVERAFREYLQRGIYQSAKAAAYDIHALITMFYAGVDKAFYYRGDAGPLGIFNSENNYSYASQAFYLFNLMFATPNIFTYLGDPNNIGVNPKTGDADPNEQWLSVLTGTVILAGISDDRKYVNILISTYGCVPYYFAPAPNGGDPPSTYTQHYVDSSNDIDTLSKNPYAVNAWFGGTSPSQMQEGQSDCPSSLVPKGNTSAEQIFSYPPSNSVSTLGIYLLMGDTVKSVTGFSLL